MIEDRRSLNDTICDWECGIAQCTMLVAKGQHIYAMMAP